MLIGWNLTAMKNDIWNSVTILLSIYYKKNYNFDLILTDIPTRMKQHYRYKEMKYWNEEFTKLSEAPYNYPQSLPTQRTTHVYIPPRNTSRKGPPSWLFNPRPEMTHAVLAKPTQEVYGTKVYFGTQKPDNMEENVYGTVLESPAKEVRQSYTMNIVTILGGVFLMINLILFTFLYFKCYRNKKNNVTKVDETETNDGEKRQMDEEAFLLNGCNIVSMMSKSSKSEDTYEAVRADTPGYKLSRQISGSTIDAHTKVRDWIAQEIIYKYSPKFFRKQDNMKTKVNIAHENAVPAEVDGLSTLGRSPTRPVSPIDNTDKNPVMKTSTITRPKIKPAKVSVAIDATPTGRGPSVLMQQPIELTKSLDYPGIKPSLDVPLRRSLTLEDFSPRIVDKKEIRKSTTSINLEAPQIEPTIIKIDHKHSRSDPVQDVNYSEMKRLRTFNPNADINVTSRDDNHPSHTPLTPEEALMTIKRRNFPKVLPDHPGREALMSKRRSMPAPGLFLPIPEISSFSQPNSPMTKSVTKLPPALTPRTTTLSKPGPSAEHVFISESTLVEETNEEPEIVCNNLYVGPIVPRNNHETSKMNQLNTQPIYDSLKNLRVCEGTNETVSNKPKAVVTANSNVKRADPKVVVRPTLSKKPSDDKVTKHIPRVVSPDNLPHLVRQTSTDEVPVKTEISEKDRISIVDNRSESPSMRLQRQVKKSQIPTLVKTPTTVSNKESSSSDSTPSEESDTGTVVKKI